ncbi:Complement C2 [Holothuria leucospilota]|uniref:Complement C2 n=1 Tax=Holothuria leucospilota TaxID=206669 RepID=A0A9Q1HA96_HOLLE|nr:Complement C2 [Holothuria leucospilota]
MNIFWFTACRPLAPPGNGSIIIHPSGRFIGSEATFLCDDGFELIGNAVRICQANKTWNGIDPTCQKSTAPLGTIPIPATCERLPAPLNGRQIFVQEDGGVVEDTVVIFQCNDGYERTSGNLRRICREDGSWSGFDVVCSPGYKEDFPVLLMAASNSVEQKKLSYMKWKFLQVFMPFLK